MSKAKITHVLELTEDEAAALVMLSCSGVYSGDWLSERLIDIAASLEKADPGLHDKQYARWAAHGEPMVMITTNDTQEH